MTAQPVKRAKMYVISDTALNVAVELVVGLLIDTQLSLIPHCTDYSATFSPVSVNLDT